MRTPSLLVLFGFVLFTMVPGAPVRAAGVTLKPGYRLTAFALSHDGAYCATGNGEGLVQLWDLGSGARVSLPREHGSEVTGIRFSPDGRWMASFSEDDEEARLQLWPLDGEDAQAGPALTHDFPINEARFSRTGNRLLTASNDGEATVWDVTSGEVAAGPIEHDKSVYGAIWSPGESRILTWTSEGVAQQWSAQTGMPTGEAMKHEDVIWDAAYAPDGSWAVTGSGDGTARVWDASSGQPTQALDHPDAISSVHVSPDGTWILTECFDGALRFFDPRSGKLLGDPIVAKGIIDQVRISPAGDRLLVLAGGVQVWDIASRELVAAYPEGATPVDGGAFHPRGKQIVIWWRNGHVKLWDPG